MYTTKQFVNSSETTISFSLTYHDWCLLEESVLWEHLDEYLEACQSTARKTPQERAKILEMEVGKIEQPREPRLYPNEEYFPIRANSSAEKTLQSVDSTLKRMEVILLELKNHFSALDSQAS